jgi:hypothetical protein
MTAKKAANAAKPEHPIDHFRRILDPYDRIALDMLIWDAGIFGPESISSFRGTVVGACKSASESPEEEPSKDDLLYAAYMLGLAMGLRVAGGVR